MPNINAPQVNINNLSPPKIKVVNENIYYVINKSGKKIFDTNDNYYGESTGYSLRPTYKSVGAIEIKNSNESYWIRGTVKYIIEDNYMLSDIFKITA